MNSVKLDLGADKDVSNNNTQISDNSIMMLVQFEPRISLGTAILTHTVHSFLMRSILR